MNIETITQKNLDKIFEEYVVIAFSNYKLDKSRIPRNGDFKEMIQDFHFEYRMGIEGWAHTKLIAELEPDGEIEWKISPNGDRFTREQKKILRKLDKWVKELNGSD